MTRNHKRHLRQRAAIHLIERFARDENGHMTILGAYMILIMLIMGGIGVDLMHNEMDRTRMQHVSDRAVLAAADLDQTRPPQEVVDDYFEKSGMGDFVSNVEIQDGLNFRNVTVTAATDTNTMFMRHLGVDTLPVPSRATAEENVNKVEISLVLDISGSMKDNDKLENMQRAAGSFVDAVLDPDHENRISINLVPYSEQVNIGRDMFQEFNVNTLHPYSTCLEFAENQFSQAHIDLDRRYEHMQHFQWNTFSVQAPNVGNTRFDTVCPRFDYEAIVPFSQNATLLKERINLLQPRAGTQIFLGMKWATGMLDPRFNKMTTKLVSNGVVDDEFSDRPSNFLDEETEKVIVLMTDGQNSAGNRIAPFYYRTQNLRLHWALNNFNWWLSRNVPSRFHGQFSFTKYTASRGDALLASVCQAAKDSGIEVWTIGFEVTDHGNQVMQDCASSPAHNQRVEGIDIDAAFTAIARQINQLRLTQ